MEQRTDEWFAARAGKVTASRISDVIAKTKSGYSASRANYMAQLVAAMQWGTDTEPFARAAYEIEKDVFVEEVALVPHPSIQFSAASPDGLVGDDGLLEIKCPNTATHIDYLIANKVPEKYKPQMAWQMACTGRKWCDFVSYDPRMPEVMQMLLVRYERDDAYIAELEAEVTKFLNEVDEQIAQLKQIRKAV
jgi:putative phage-type endonuclease